MSEFNIYKGSEAVALDLHEPRLWYYEPKGWLGGEVYSEGYKTKKAAQAAAEAWAAQQAAEGAAAASENLPSEDDSFIDVTCSFFNADAVNVWPNHEKITVRAKDLESALTAVHTLLELECHGLIRGDGYNVGDEIVAHVWDESGKLYTLNHVLTAEDGREGSLDR